MVSTVFTDFQSMIMASSSFISHISHFFWYHIPYITYIPFSYPIYPNCPKQSRKRRWPIWVWTTCTSLYLRRPMAGTAGHDKFRWKKRPGSRRIHWKSLAYINIDMITYYDIYIYMYTHTYIYLCYNIIYTYVYIYILYVSYIYILST